MTNKKIKIKTSQANQRIDKFLADFYAEKSRASWQKRIKGGEVLVNDRIIKSDYVLKEGDRIVISNGAEWSEKSINLATSTRLNFSPAARNDSFQIVIPKIKIIYEDDDVIVINKPAGVLAQKAISSASPAVSDFLVKHYPKIKEVGQKEQRFGIVHRLDKDTSGIMVVAKNNKAFEFLKDQFKNRSVQKKYLALVYGKVKPKEGMIDLKIGRSKTKPDKQTVIDTKKKEMIKSREASTAYKTIKNFNDFTLLEVLPKTGRMHQIRVHLKAIGYPVVGDQKYFFRKYKNKNLELNRQFLHASELKIKLLDGKERIFKTELAEDLKKFLNSLLF